MNEVLCSPFAWIAVVSAAAGPIIKEN